MESLEEQKLFDTPLSRRRVTVLKVAYQLKDAKVAESTPDDVLASIENDDDIEVSLTLHVSSVHLCLDVCGWKLVGRKIY